MSTNFVKDIAIAAIGLALDVLIVVPLVLGFGFCLSAIGDWLWCDRDWYYHATCQAAQFADCDCYTLFGSIKQTWLHWVDFANRLW